MGARRIILILIMAAVMMFICSRTCPHSAALAAEPEAASGGRDTTDGENSHGEGQAVVATIEESPVGSIVPVTRDEKTNTIRDVRMPPVGTIMPMGGGFRLRRTERCPLRGDAGCDQGDRGESRLEPVRRRPCQRAMAA